MRKSPLGMAPASGPIKVLMARPAEAVYDVETAPMSRASGQSREREDTKRLPSAGYAKDSNLQPPRGVVLESMGGLSCEHGHGDPDSIEFVSDLPGYVLDATGGRREVLDDDCDVQGGILSGCFRTAFSSGLASDPLIRRIRRAPDPGCARTGGKGLARADE